MIDDEQLPEMTPLFPSLRENLARFVAQQTEELKAEMHVVKELDLSEEPSPPLDSPGPGGHSTDFFTYQPQLYLREK